MDRFEGESGVGEDAEGHQSRGQEKVVDLPVDRLGKDLMVDRCQKYSRLACTSDSTPCRGQSYRLKIPLDGGSGGGGGGLGFSVAWFVNLHHTALATPDSDTWRYAQIAFDRG